MINLATKEELEMPSEFDEFSGRAHTNYSNASKAAMENRDLLIHTMERPAFQVWHHEWWHFDLKNWQNYPVVDFMPVK